MVTLYLCFVNICNKYYMLGIIFLRDIFIYYIFIYYFFVVHVIIIYILLLLTFKIFLKFSCVNKFI